MKSLTIYIDPYTCRLNDVSPEKFRDKLKSALDKYNADVIISHIAENSAQGDFSKSATVSRVSSELENGESMEEINELVFSVARQVLSEFKSMN